MGRGVLDVNRIINGNVLDVLKTLPSNFVDTVVTSPPYWGLRDYGDQNNIVWGGEPDCEHEWGATLPPLRHRWGDTTNMGEKQRSNRGSYQNVVALETPTGNFCNKCGAWRGQLGLEPHPQMYVEHITEIMRETKRVLKKTGSLWLNIGDTMYTKSGSNFTGSCDSFSSRAERVEIAKANKIRGLYRSNWLQSKQKLMIPARVAISLQDNDGWILRNEVIWHKLNHMPESIRDRLTKSYESIYFFVKNKKYYFDQDAIRIPYPKSTMERVNRQYISNPKTYAENFNTSKHQNWQERVLKSEKKGANPRDVWTLTTESFKGAHFATFPKKLVRRILKCSCPPRGLVLDPFNGSGTTAYVAHRMGLDWLGIDLNPEYCKMSEKRILSHGKLRLDKYLEQGV